MRQLMSAMLLTGIAWLGHCQAGEPTKQDRKEIDRKAAEDHLRRIMVAMLKHHDVHGRFPPFATHDKNNKPLLSWRVTLLPYLDEAKLHREFKLTEPWESVHNKALLKKMPHVYALPGAKTKHNDMTFLRVFVGASTVFHNNEGSRISEIRDGLANTMMVVEGTDAVPWTKPEELSYFAGQPIPKVGGHFQNGFLAAYCDGSTRLIRNDFDSKRMRLAIVRNDGYGLPDEPGQP